MRSYVLRWFAFASLTISFLSAICFGQPPANEGQVATPAADTDEPSGEPSAAKESNAAQPVASAADFAGLYAEWRTKLDKLIELRDQFLVAANDDKPALRDKMAKVIDEGETLLPRLAASAEVAFLADPKANGDATSFLAEMLRDQMRKNDYEQANRLAEVLVQQGTEQKEIAALAGIAAFMVNEFDLAGKHFTAAEQAGVISGEARAMQAKLDYYRKLWKEESELRAAEAEADDLPRVKLKTTKGDIVIELFENEAPQTVGNFVNLVEKKFYDGLIFHRVLPNFMAQGGCPLGNGTGDPGYSILCECIKEKHRKHFRGVISMAHSGPNTGGSQFFLNFVPTDHLDGKHTVFGRIVSGMDVLAKLKRRTPDNQLPADKIVEATVLRKREHEYKPTIAGAQDVSNEN